MDKNKCLEMIQNILNSVFNGYYETRILRQDIKEEEWAHAIHTAKRMPLTTLFEEQKRDELVKCFEYMKSGIAPVEPGLQSGFVQPAEGVEVPEGEVIAASIEEPVEATESAEEPATEEAPAEESTTEEPATEETAVESDPVETTEPVAETTEEHVETTEELATEEPTAEEPAVESDPVETIVEASEPAEETAEEPATEENPVEEAPAEETKSRRRKK